MTDFLFFLFKSLKLTCWQVFVSKQQLFPPQICSQSSRFLQTETAPPREEAFKLNLINRLQQTGSNGDPFRRKCRTAVWSLSGSQNGVKLCIKFNHNIWLKFMIKKSNAFFLGGGGVLYKPIKTKKLNFLHFLVCFFVWKRKFWFFYSSERRKKQQKTFKKNIKKTK